MKSLIVILVFISSSALAEKNTCSINGTAKDIQYHQFGKMVSARYDIHPAPSHINKLEVNIQTASDENLAKAVRKFISQEDSELYLSAAENDFKFINEKVAAGAKWLAVEQPTNTKFEKIKKEYPEWRQKLQKAGLTEKEIDQMTTLSFGSGVSYWLRQKSPVIAIYGVEDEELLTEGNMIDLRISNELFRFFGNFQGSESQGLELIKKIESHVLENKKKGVSVDLESIEKFFEDFNLGEERIALTNIGQAYIDLADLGDQRDKIIIPNLKQIMQKEGNGILLFGMVHQKEQMRLFSEGCGKSNQNKSSSSSSDKKGSSFR